jgi:hypothetical protein
MTTTDICFLVLGAACFAVALLVAVAMTLNRKARQREADEQRRRKLPVIEHWAP